MKGSMTGKNDFFFVDLIKTREWNDNNNSDTEPVLTGR